jgi:hypothetical protein
LNSGQAGLNQLVNEFGQILFELGGFDVIFREQNRACRLWAGVRQEQLPQANAYFIETEVTGAGKIKNDAFPGDLLKQGFGGEHDTLGQHGEQPYENIKRILRCSAKKAPTVAGTSRTKSDELNADRTAIQGG